MKNKYGLSNKMIMLLLTAMDEGIYYRWYDEDKVRCVNWCAPNNLSLDLTSKKIIMYYEHSDTIYEEFSFNKHKITWAIDEEALL